MPDISTRDAISQLLAVLGEAFEGPPHESSYFTDSGAASGLFGTLDGLSAADASRMMGGSSIAAHAHHASFAVHASEAWIRGDRSSQDWTQSWSVSTVDESAWSRLRKDLRARYAALRRTVESHALGSADAFGGAAGALAHAAYHLGAIRQKVAWSRKS